MYPRGRSLVKRLADKQFAFLGINSDTDRKQLQQTVTEQQITWRSWWDGGGTLGPIATAWRVMYWPTTYVLDSKGIIRYKDLPGDVLEKAVDALLQEAEKDRPSKR